MSKLYQKQSLSIDEQISLLKERKLIINDEKSAKTKLNSIGYYHLSAYLKSFQNHETNTFDKNITFEQVLNLYIFDRKLKAFCFDAIERVELSLKALLNNIIAQNLGNNWFENADSFIDKFQHNDKLNKLRKKYNYLKKKDGVIKEFYKKYPKEKSFPPSWIFTEVLSFGETVMLFKNLKREHRKKVAKLYGIDEKVLISWFILLNDIRNICAHHGRLWNRNLKKVVIPKAFKKIPLGGNMFTSLVVFSYLLSVLSPHSELIPNIINLMKHAHINLTEMGCGEHWEDNLSHSQNIKIIS